jgi:glycosyltransferase involved in cell wall biosynthesis
MTVEISVVVIFHNMHREAKRTIFSLSPFYQIESNNIDYEVIAIDSNSSKPISVDTENFLGNKLRYFHLKSKTRSPAAAINWGVEQSRGKLVIVLIDGARILSPGILRLMQKAYRAVENPFIYTLSMHLGPDIQNNSVMNGYDEHVEDKILAESGWEFDGYRLFDISSVALSSKSGFFSHLSESNCFGIKRDDFKRLKGFDESFISPGGGLVNLDWFNKVHQDKNINPIMLLGEATFHQIHGGVATNVTLDKHPWNLFVQEYISIRNQDYKNFWREPMYMGYLPDSSKRFAGLAIDGKSQI